MSNVLLKNIGTETNLAYVFLNLQQAGSSRASGNADLPKTESAPETISRARVGLHFQPPLDGACTAAHINGKTHVKLSGKTGNYQKVRKQKNNWAFSGLGQPNGVRVTGKQKVTGQNTKIHTAAIQTSTPSLKDGYRGRIGSAREPH